MRRTAIISFIVAAALFTACAAWPVWSVAEPISESDVAPPPAATAPTTQEMPEVKDAATKFTQRDVDGAVKLLKEAVKKNADLPPAWVIIAQWFLQTNNGQAAHNALERAVVESPNDPQAYTILGEIAIQQRHVAEAGAMYETANGLMAGFSGSGKRKAALQTTILSGLARTAELREDWTGAQKRLEEWLKLEPQNTAALQQLAQCLFQQTSAKGERTKVDEALAKLRDAFKIDQERIEKEKAKRGGNPPTSPEEAAKLEPTILTPEATIALFYHAARDEKHETKAQEWMIKALNAAPRDINTRLVAGQWAWETGQLEEAKKQAAVALQLDANALKAKLLCGLIALFQKDYKAAELYFESAVLQSPKDSGASNNLALALIEQGDPAKRDRALQYAEANVQKYQKWPEGFSTYGWVLYKLGRLDEAEKMISQSIQLSGGSFSPETAYYLARIVAAIGNRDNDPKRLADAKRLLEEAVKTTAPFAQRNEAKELLQELTKAAEKPAEKPAK